MLFATIVGYEGFGMEIRRDAYLDELLSKRWNGLVKVITGIRRCGKSYLLKTIFRRRLLEEGVKEENIITFELDTLKDVPFRNPSKRVSTVRSIIGGSSEDNRNEERKTCQCGT